MANNPADTPADVQMSAADVAYVVAWEKQTGITLNLAFNGIGACTAPDRRGRVERQLHRQRHRQRRHLHRSRPGRRPAATPTTPAFVNALLADQADFNWITHTWSHLFLGCTVWQPQAAHLGDGQRLRRARFTAGSYSYEITAATAYGESEPSAAAARSPSAPSGSVTLTWPEATNGTGTDGTPGPTLAQEEATHTGGTGFWGYNVYREDPGSTTYGLVGQVPENPAATSATTYSFTDTGATAPGAAPDSGPDFPTATNPGIDCSSARRQLAAGHAAPGRLLHRPGDRPGPGLRRGQRAHQLHPGRRGDRRALRGREPQHAGRPGRVGRHHLRRRTPPASRSSTRSGGALGAPRYPSNIYYNASNWPDELNEYNTLYVAQGDSLGDPACPGETGHCTDTVGHHLPDHAGHRGQPARLGVAHHAEPRARQQPAGRLRPPVRPDRPGHPERPGLRLHHPDPASATC